MKLVYNHHDCSSFIVFLCQDPVVDLEAHFFSCTCTSHSQTHTSDFHHPGLPCIVCQRDQFEIGRTSAGEEEVSVNLNLCVRARLLKCVWVRYYSKS